jgi:hypothetical protein
MLIKESRGKKERFGKDSLKASFLYLSMMGEVMIAGEN